MKEFLSFDVIVALAVAAGLMLIVTIFVVYARRKLQDAGATSTQLDDFALDVARRTSLLLFIPIALQAGARNLTLPADQMALLAKIVHMAIIAQAALWSAGLLDFFIRRHHRARLETDPATVTTVRAFRFATLAAVWIIATLVALDNLGINVTTLITGLGIGGIAIALALQNILSDLFASLSIVLDKPFVVGDFIVVSGDAGTVEQIGLKTTRVRALSGELLVFSNADLLQSRIRNYKRMAERRILFRVGVLYQTDPLTLRRIPSMVQAIVERSTRARFDRAHFASFGDSSYDFEFVYYVLSAEYNAYMDVQQEINLGIVDAFTKENIGFAYPTRTIFLEKE